MSVEDQNRDNPFENGEMEQEMRQTPLTSEDHKHLEVFAHLLHAKLKRGERIPDKSLWDYEPEDWFPSKEEKQ